MKLIETIKKLFGVIVTNETCQTISHSPSNTNTQVFNVHTNKNMQEYALTIFLNSVGTKPSAVKNNDNYPVYITTECGISKPKEYHENLIKNGYLQKASFVSVLSLYTTTELKSILEKFDLKKTGNKEELIIRINENVSEEFKNSYEKNNYYELTELGKSILDKNQDYISLHRHRVWNITPIEYSRHKNNNPEKSFYEICLDIFDARITKYLKELNHNMIKCTYLYKAQLYEKEKDCYWALYNYLIVLLYDVSGISNTFEGQYFKGMEVYFNISCTDKIMIYQNEYNDEMLHQIYELHKPHFCICPYNYFSEIVNNILCDTFDKEETSKKLKSLFVKYIN